MAASLEGIQCRHDVLHHVVLLGNLSLDLLPLHLPHRIINSAQQSVYLLNHPLVVDCAGLVVAQQAHLPGQLGVLPDISDADRHLWNTEYWANYSTGDR